MSTPIHTKNKSKKRGGKIILLQESSYDDDEEKEYEYDTNANADKNVFQQDDFVMCKNERGEIVSCGFNIQSLLLKQGISPMSSVFQLNREDDDYRVDVDADVDADVDVNADADVGNRIAIADMGIHDALSVPAGLCYVNERIPRLNKHVYVEEEEDVSDDIIDRLLELASTHERQKRRTRKNVPVVFMVSGGSRENKRKSRKYK